MMNKRILVLIFNCLILSNYAWAQPYCEESSPETTRIYFANGMSNNEPAARSSANEVRLLLGSAPGNSYYYSYNHNENWLIQLLEVYRQRQEEFQQEVKPEEYWYWLSHLDDAPPWFQDEYQRSMQDFQESSVYNDPELTEHVTNYVQDIYNGKRVVIVGHSQGNFYANNAYRRILNEHPEYQQYIGIVGVATPSDKVLGWNNFNKSYPYGLYYTTNESDLIMNLVRAVYPDTLPPNPSDQAGGYSNGFFNTNHGFVSTYLDRNGPFRDRIHDHIIQTINEIPIPERDPDCQPVSVETLAATNITTNSARLNGQVITGNNVDVGFVSKPSYDSSPLSCFDITINSPEVYEAGDYFASDVSLQDNTTYYYRACAREGNSITQGVILNFKTNSIPVMQCGSTRHYNGGTNGLTTDYIMGTVTGHVDIEFIAYTIKDKLEIWQGGTRILNTGYVAGTQNYNICHHADKGSTWTIKVFGNADPDTKWDLTISCPDPTLYGVFDLCY